MDRQSLSSRLTHSSLAHENVYHLCDNDMEKKTCIHICDMKIGFQQTIATKYKNRFNIFFNTLRPRQNGRHCPDDIFMCIFLVKIMAWRRPGDSHYLNHWWLVYRRIYMSFRPNELMSMFAITVCGKFLGRAIPIIVPFPMFENLFQDWDTVLKKSIMFVKKIY